MHGVFAQSDSVRVHQKAREAMIAAIQSGVGISQTLADSVYSINTTYRLKMHDVVRSRVTNEQKEQGIKRLAAERDRKIRQILSADQVTKLNAVYSRNRSNGPTRPVTPGTPIEKHLK